MRNSHFCEILVSWYSVFPNRKVWNLIPLFVWRRKAMKQNHSNVTNFDVEFVIFELQMMEFSRAPGYPPGSFAYQNSSLPHQNECHNSPNLYHNQQINQLNFHQNRMNYLDSDFEYKPRLKPNMNSNKHLIANECQNVLITDFQNFGDNIIDNYGKSRKRNQISNHIFRSSPHDDTIINVQNIISHRHDSDVQDDLDVFKSIEKVNVSPQHSSNSKIESFQNNSDNAIHALKNLANNSIHFSALSNPENRIADPFMNHKNTKLQPSQTHLIFPNSAAENNYQKNNQNNTLPKNFENRIGTNCEPHKSIERSDLLENNPQVAFPQSIGSCREGISPQNVPVEFPDDIPFNKIQINEQKTPDSSKNQSIMQFDQISEIENIELAIPGGSQKTPNRNIPSYQMNNSLVTNHDAIDCSFVNPGVHQTSHTSAQQHQSDLPPKQKKKATKKTKKQVKPKSTQTTSSPKKTSCHITSRKANQAPPSPEPPRIVQTLIRISLVPPQPKNPTTDKEGESNENDKTGENKVVKETPPEKSKMSPLAESLSEQLTKGLLNNLPKAISYYLKTQVLQVDREKNQKKRQSFTGKQKAILDEYLRSHMNNPYASIRDIARLSELTGLEQKQVRTYFTNKRMRDSRFANIHGTRRKQPISVHY
ncbi:hypothetical protein TRFO_25683 [Tritrichomonas foetus]|uniref:Homeobox domain-containing protein n=1 Tax=Tritrichomonas foetus TaxID=1144522 RepID=A0A1J4K994_9EUKA|nr:hypothetical protein TRFO_25683 [Tritrichomonas foetus]|eukprot:OHT06276.1 hypothetical protein TRFO_25683 [Tritrichomonas foetus]